MRLKYSQMKSKVCKSVVVHSCGPIMHRMHIPDVGFMVLRALSRSMHLFGKNVILVSVHGGSSDAELEGADISLAVVSFFPFSLPPMVDPTPDLGLRTRDCLMEGTDGGGRCAFLFSTSTDSSCCPPPEPAPGRSMSLGGVRAYL